MVAVGLWILCLTWAHRNTRRRGQEHGKLPSGLPRRYLGPSARDAAMLLVKVKLWDETDDGGWVIHDFDDYLPTGEVRDKRSEAGKRGAEKRWAGHIKKQKKTDISDDGDSKMPSDDSNLPSPSHDVAIGLPEPCHDVDGKPMASDGSRAPARRVSPTEILPIPIPEPEPKDLKTKNQKDPSDLSSSTIVPIARPDIDQVCLYLADKIEENGSLRPAVTKAWHDAARLMIDKDGRTVVQILRCIDWAQSNTFWRTNIMSMPKLRRHYDRLRLQAQTERQQGSATDRRLAENAAVVERFRPDSPKEIT